MYFILFLVWMTIVPFSFGLHHFFIFHLSFFFLTNSLNCDKIFKSTAIWLLHPMPLKHMLLALLVVAWQVKKNALHSFLLWNLLVGWFWSYSLSQHGQTFYNMCILVFLYEKNHFQHALFFYRFQKVEIIFVFLSSFLLSKFSLIFFMNFVTTFSSLLALGILHLLLLGMHVL